MERLEFRAFHAQCAVCEVAYYRTGMTADFRSLRSQQVITIGRACLYTYDCFGPRRRRILNSLSAQIALYKPAPSLLPFAAGFLLVCLAAVLLVSPAQAQPSQPAQPLQQAPLAGPSEVWDLQALYPNAGDWELAMKEISAQTEELEKCRGQVATSARTLEQCLPLFTRTLQKVLRAYVYAQIGSDQDLRDAAWQRRVQQGQLAYNALQKISSFYEPELIDRGKSILKWSRKSKPLAPYAFYFADLLRRSDHTLHAEGETLLAGAEANAGQFNEAYSTLMNAEIPWPQLATPSGEEVLLNSQGYSQERQSLDRGYRALVFERFFSTLRQFSKTSGHLLSGQIRHQAYVARTRNFSSALQARLHSDNLPPAVYDTLVQTTRQTLPTLQRYFRFRQRMLGVNQLRYYDLYPPLVPALNRKFPLQEGAALLLEALAPLGGDYTDRLRRGLGQRWMHVRPSPGKRSGAYMNGSAYAVHPYILLNYADGFGDVSTLAHEWGHAIHTLYTNENQPFAKADYSTFTAELAAILPQTLLIDHMIAQAPTPQERLFYLAEAMEDIRGTFYRQTMFAEFEQQMHEMAEKDEVVDAASLSAAYRQLVREYHGSDAGGVAIPSYIQYEWAYIPHFYYNFYVFQYATSMAAAFYLSEQIRKEGAPAAERFLNILRAGGSDYPYQILKKAGVDMADPQVYRAVAGRMEYLLTQAELTLAEVEGRKIE